LPHQALKRPSVSGDRSGGFRWRPLGPKSGLPPPPSMSYDDVRCWGTQSPYVCSRTVSVRPCMCLSLLLQYSLIHVQPFECQLCSCAGAAFVFSIASSTILVINTKCVCSVFSSYSVTEVHIVVQPATAKVLPFLTSFKVNIQLFYKTTDIFCSEHF
jgi:hypothetical protein